MSQRNSKKGPKAAAAPPDIYVGLLFGSVAALIVGCLLLALELQSYGWAGPGR